MNPIQIIVDSTVDLNKELIEQYKIKVVPLHSIVPDETIDYLDGITMSTPLLYEKVDKYNKIPQTSARNVGEFIQDFQEEIDQGKDIIYIGIGSAFSSTFSNAYLAKQEFDEKRFKYLHKSGRCKGFVRLIGDALHIHPVVRILNGELKLIKISRGKFQFALDWQVKDFEEQLKNNNVDLNTITVIDADRTEGEENYLYDKVSKLVPDHHIYRIKAGCIISAHCGPGTTGLYYLKKHA